LVPRDTRDALVVAAQERFATQGFPGTSIRELAAAVGIKESSVYHHFPSKQAILDAVLGRADDRLGDLSARFGVPLDDADAAAPVYAEMEPERLDEIAGGFLDAWLHDPDLLAALRILTLEQYRTPAAGRRLRALLVDEPPAFQTQLFTGAGGPGQRDRHRGAGLIDRGVFRPADPAAVALAFWGPVVMVLTGAVGQEAEPEARRRLRTHLDHFRSTHLATNTTRRNAP